MQFGIDEVGRGSWAGPLLVVGVLARTDSLVGVDDSKNMTAAARNKMLEAIKLNAASIEMCWVSNVTIDKIGLSASMNNAVNSVFSSVSKQGYDTIIDGNINYLGGFSNTRALIKADSSIAAVSAASIIAKCARDKYMQRMAASFPEYGFESHVGYGTQRHRVALEKYGLTPLHRTSYKPVARIMNESTRRSRS